MVKNVNLKYATPVLLSWEHPVSVEYVSFSQLSKHINQETDTK